MFSFPLKEFSNSLVKCIKTPKGKYVYTLGIPKTI